MKSDKSTNISSSDSDKEVRNRRMKTQEDVRRMLHLKELGHTPNRIATIIGCHRDTVKRYLKQGEWKPIERARQLQGLGEWLETKFMQHDGNADVIRQELQAEHDIGVSLRTVERAVRPFRRRVKAAREATERFETPPGDQLQIDFGSKRVAIGDESPMVHVFVATLGYSRRQFASAHEDESQAAWFDGLERAFHHFGGVPRTVLMDNPKSLVTKPRTETTTPTFNDRLLAFARHWKFTPRACHPYRARTKGKDERSVGYVKHNALAGRTFSSWGELDRHLETWLTEVADPRRHGTTGMTPLELFEQERVFLSPLADRPPFGNPTELMRKVSKDCMVALDTNCYSVPWRLVGATVQVSLVGDTFRVWQGSDLVAEHARCNGRRQRIVDREHLQNIGQVERTEAPAPLESSESQLTRSLEDYELFVMEMAS